MPSSGPDPSAGLPPLLLPAITVVWPGDATASASVDDASSPAPGNLWATLIGVRLYLAKLPSCRAPFGEISMSPLMYGCSKRSTSPAGLQTIQGTSIFASSSIHCCAG